MVCYKLHTRRHTRSDIVYRIARMRRRMKVSFIHGCNNLIHGHTIINSRRIPQCRYFIGISIIPNGSTRAYHHPIRCIIDHITSKDCIKIIGQIGPVKERSSKINIDPAALIIRHISNRCNPGMEKGCQDGKGICNRDLSIS